MRIKLNIVDRNQVETRRRAILPAIILAALGGWMLWRRNPFFYIPSFLCVYFLAGIVIHPVILKPANMLVGGISKALLWLTTRLILIGVWFLIITPIAIWFRIRGRDRLRLKFPSGETSFWRRRPPEEQEPRLEKQY